MIGVTLPIMTLTNAQMKELGEAVEPLVDFLRRQGRQQLSVTLIGPRMNKNEDVITMAVTFQGDDELDLPEAMQAEEEMQARAKTERGNRAPRHSKRRWRK